MFSPSVAAEITAVRLDGASVTGELKSWDKSRVILEVATGEESLAVKDLLSLRWVQDVPATSPEAKSPIEVELSDGTVMPVTEFTLSRSKASARLVNSASGEAQALALDRKQIAAVRLAPIAGELVDQWKEIRAMELATDMLVLLKRNGQSLDYAEGVIGDVSPETVHFKLDEDELQIDRSKVAAFVFYQREASLDSDSYFVVEGRDGLKANVAKATLNGESLAMVTAGGTKFNWPLDEIVAVDFSAGKLAYLSDLDPASVTTTPLISLPVGASLSANYHEPRRDKSAYGGPLTLGPTNDASDAVTRSYMKGLAARSRTEIVYRLPAGYRRLSSMVGIDPATRANGKVRLKVLGDDQPLFDEELAGTEPPRELNVEIDGVKRLKLIVDYGDNLDTGDWLNMCDLRISK
jgi:NPCBM/NEW2 domain